MKIVATLALGSRPRQRGCKVAGQEEGSPGVKAKALQRCGPRRSPSVTSQTLESVRKCEGVCGNDRKLKMNIVSCKLLQKVKETCALQTTNITCTNHRIPNPNPNMLKRYKLGTTKVSKF